MGGKWFGAAVHVLQEAWLGLVSLLVAGANRQGSLSLISVVHISGQKLQGLDWLSVILSLYTSVLFPAGRPVFF